jgi:hypothetical protein
MGTNLQVARAYMAVTDPHMPKRTWKEVIDFIIEQKEGPNRKRWVNVSKDKALAPLWSVRVVERDGIVSPFQASGRTQAIELLPQRGCVICDDIVRADHDRHLVDRGPVRAGKVRDELQCQWC